MDKNELIKKYPILKDMILEKEILWLNPDITNDIEDCELTMDDINDVENRLQRFAPLIAKYFPETRDQSGIIESPLQEIKQMKKLINNKYNAKLEGKLLLKMDSHLAIAGSIKARGGIYEVLKHTEELALNNKILTQSDNYEILTTPEKRSFFNDYTIQVGSTGNLGLSIGIMSAMIGYQVIVHMSIDAKQWKKDLLRKHGVIVKEYESDYSEAVKRGRALSNQDLHSYFVDDENSRNLFLGYALAAKRLKQQLKDKHIKVDHEHPLFVYLPCGVGGAPGGITFGLKLLFGNNVHCFFVEPTQAPCMALGMITGLNNQICVQDIGLTGLTEADGLAVGRASGFVGNVMKKRLSGEFTVTDAKLYDYLRDLWRTENIFLEPSACAAFQGVIKNQLLQSYFERNRLSDKMAQAVHIAWATGGSLVPDEIREQYLKTYL